MSFHGKLIGPSGQIYLCEHNHRTLTAAATCANSSSTRRMAAMAWNRAAVEAAQAAAAARKRDEERAAAQARRIAAQEASAARRAASLAAAEEARAAKRAARLAAMSPRRAWRRMTPQERLLRTAEAELQVYGEIISADAKAVYEGHAAKPAAPSAPALWSPRCPRRRYHRRHVPRQISPTTCVLLTPASRQMSGHSLKDGLRAIPGSGRNTRPRSGRSTRRRQTAKLRGSGRR